jgi:hypothetical protein
VALANLVSPTEKPTPAIGSLRTKPADRIPLPTAPRARGRVHARGKGERASDSVFTGTLGSDCAESLEAVPPLDGGLAPRDNWTVRGRVETR